MASFKKRNVKTHVIAREEGFVRGDVAKQSYYLVSFHIEETASFLAVTITLCFVPRSDDQKVNVH